MDDIAKIEKEIEQLEKKLSKDHFSGLLNHAGRKKDERRLSKLRKELEKLRKERKSKKEK